MRSGRADEVPGPPSGGVPARHEASALGRLRAALPGLRPPSADRPTVRRLAAWSGRILAVCLALLIAGTFLVAATIVYVAMTLPLPDEAQADPQPSLLLEAADGRVFATRGSFRGVHVRLEDLPPYVTDAVVSIEDRRFFDHPGLDPRGILRAALTDLTAGRVREGGSTITQQLAKLLFLSEQRTFRRKLQEACLALWLDARLGKREILERYLNAAYFGAGAYGIEGASRRYFGKPAHDLSLPEAAMLAGLVQAPSAYAPTRDLAQARARAETVLHAMVEAGRLDKAAAEDAIAHPATLAVEPDTDPGRGYFADWAADEARRLLGPVAAEFTLKTTLDPDLQATAERVVQDWLAREGQKRHVSQAALVAIKPDGAVLAIVGGRDYARSQFSRATQARRQPGSLFKLFVYLAALEAGMTPDSVMVDQPVDIDGWKPENADGRFRGEVTLRQAFAQSINSIAAQLLQRVGPQRVIDLARSLGVASPLSPDPSLALGTSGVTLLEMTRAYAAVAADRASVEPFAIRSVSGARGEIFYARQPPADAPPPWPRQQALDLLLAAVRAGTGAHAAYDRPAAGKTGTTQDNRDAWFVGFTADAVVGVWVGNDDDTPMRDVTGGGLPAEIWRDFMRAADSLKTAPAADAAASVRGPAQVVDTATLRVGGAVVRLAGVTGAGGPQAARLRAALDGRELACEPAEGDAYRCLLGNEDLALDLVGGGFARAAPDAPPPLRDAERQARADRRGLWGQ